MLLRKSTDYDRQLHGLMERLKLQQANNAALLAARRGLPTPPQAVQPVPVDTRTNAEKRADKILQAQELRTKLLTLMDATDAAVVLGRLTNAVDISTFNNIFPQVAVEAKKFDHVRPSQLINIFRELKSIPSTVDVMGRITGSRNAQQRKVDAVNRAIANFRNIMRVLVSSIEGVFKGMQRSDGNYPDISYPDVVQDLWLVWVLDKIFERRQINDNIPSQDLERLYALSEDWPTMAQVKTNVLSKTTPAGQLRSGVDFEKYMDEIMKIIYMPLDTIKELAKLFGKDAAESQALLDTARNSVLTNGADQINIADALKILGNAPSTTAPPPPGQAALGPAIPQMAIEAPPVTEQDDAPIIEEITHAPALPVEPVPHPPLLPVALIDPADPTTQYPNTHPVASYFPGIADYAFSYMAMGNIDVLPTVPPTPPALAYFDTKTQYDTATALWNPKVDFMNMFISQIHAIYPEYAPAAALRFVPIPPDPVPNKVLERMQTTSYTSKTAAKRRAIDADVAAGHYEAAAAKLGYTDAERTADRQRLFINTTHGAVSAPDAIPGPTAQLNQYANDYEPALRQITDNEIDNLFPLIDPALIARIPEKFRQSFVMYSLITTNWNSIQTTVNPSAGVATLTDLRLTEVYMRMQKFWQPLGGYFPQFVNSTRNPTVSRPVIGMGMHQQPRRPRSHLRVYMGRGVATSQATDEGVTVYNGPTYVPFGPYQIHRSKLIKERRVHIRTHTGGAVINMDASDHPAIVEVLKNLLKNHTLDYQAVAKMGNEDRTLLAKMLERCKMDEEYEVPYEDTEMTRFNLLKDHIIAGGNNREEIREFRQLLMKFVREKKVGHAAALEIIDELIQL